MPEHPLPKPASHLLQTCVRNATSFWIAVLAIFAGSASHPLAEPPGIEIHVANTGLDTAAGTRQRPLATLEGARNALRNLRTQGKVTPATPVHIWIHAGSYAQSHPLELGPEDSGSPTAPVTWKAWKKDVVRIHGGALLKGWRPVSDPLVLERLPHSARAHVREADLPTSPEDASMVSRGFGRPLAKAHPELFFQGQPMTLARWPNLGEFATISGFPTGQVDEHGGTIGKLESGFYFSGDRPLQWKDPSQVWVHGYWSWDWANSYERIASLNADRHWIQTAPPYGMYGFRKGQRFYYLNVLEELDQPGEWFMDAARHKVYFWPPEASRPAIPSHRGESQLSLLAGPLVQLNNASHILLQGLVLEATRGTAVEMRNGTSNTIAGCLIRNVGNHGIAIQQGVGHRVAGCDILDCGDGGVDASGGDRQTLQAGGHIIENNRFERQGRWSKCYVPAIHLRGVGLRAEHNLISDHPHCGILYWGNDHLIAFNEIHHVALETGDVGAIYTGRDYSFRGNRILNNFIHHTGGVGMGSMGAYMDDCVSGTEIVGNLFLKVERAAFIGGGRDHRVENNVFIDCKPAVQIDGRGLDKTPVWHDMVYTTMKDSLRAVPAELYRTRYPEMTTLDPYWQVTTGIPPENNRIERNLCVGPWLEIHWHAKPGEVLVRDNWTKGDPGFVNAQAGDFRLKADAPALKTGFKPIPIGEMGLRTDPLRTELRQRGLTREGGTR